MFIFIPSTYSFWACFWTAGPTSGNKETSETAAPCQIRWVPSLWMRLFNISACASRPKWSPTDLNGEKVFKGYPFPQNLTQHVPWTPINFKWKRDLNPIFRGYVSFEGVVQWRVRQNNSCIWQGFDCLFANLVFEEWLLWWIRMIDSYMAVVKEVSHDKSCRKNRQGGKNESFCNINNFTHFHKRGWFQSSCPDAWSCSYDINDIRIISCIYIYITIYRIYTIQWYEHYDWCTFTSLCMHETECISHSSVQPVICQPYTTESRRHSPIDSWTSQTESIQSQTCPTKLVLSTWLPRGMGLTSMVSTIAWTKGFNTCRDIVSWSDKNPRLVSSKSWKIRRTEPIHVSTVFNTWVNVHQSSILTKTKIDTSLHGLLS